MRKSMEFAGLLGHILISVTQAVLDGAEINSLPEWQKKGYTYPDAEDTTQINGCKIVGGALTLAGMIKMHLEREMMIERAKDSVQES